MKKLAQLGTVAVDCIQPAADGIGLYAEIHARSWKRALREPMLTFRRDFLDGLRASGWARLYVLRLAGRPIAVHLWFVLGRTAIWYSGAYDERFASTSAGSVLMWESIRRIHESGNVEIFDYLPGGTPQKERLGAERPKLHVWHISRNRVSIALQNVARNFRGAVRRFRQRETVAIPAQPPTPHLVRVAARDVKPLELGWIASEVTPDGRFEAFLAVASAAPSVQAMKGTWGGADHWWLVRTPEGRPAGLVRLRAVGTGWLAVEVVTWDETGESAERVLQALAGSIDDPLSYREAAGDGEPGEVTRFHSSPLPWSPP